jgi:proteasome lid subunit RPN8/RPN11
VKNLNEFTDHVRQRFPDEAVGYVHKDLFVPCANLSATPQEAFSVSPELIPDDAQYIVHSHTTAFPDPKVDPRTPSRADMECQDAWGLPFAIVYCDGQSMSDPIFFGTTQRRPPLEEREFVFNAQDCLTLSADYFSAKHGIELPSCPRAWDWFAHGETLIDDLWEGWGFEEVPMSKARPSDVLLFRMGARFTNHMGVYLGDDRLLHHKVGCLSGIEEASRLSKYLHRCIRHRDLQ